MANFQGICEYPECTHRTVIRLEIEVDKDAIITNSIPEDDLQYAVFSCRDHMEMSFDFLRDLVLDDYELKNPFEVEGT